MTPLCLKGLVDPILNIRLPGGLEGIGGFPSGHFDLDGGHPSFLKNVPEGILAIKMLLTSFGPEKVENEIFENVQQLSGVGEATSVVALNVGRIFLSFNDKFSK